MPTINAKEIDRENGNVTHLFCKIEEINFLNLSL